jgi:hypothetical protein
MVLPDSVVRRFWAAVDKRGPEECWEWQLSRTKGYGQLARKRGQSGYKAHRVSWMIAHGEPIPDGMEVCHHCDNPACVNPEHLFLGTHHENMLDMRDKQRHQDPFVALIAKYICDDYKKGHGSQREIARRYAVSQSTVWRVLHRQTTGG